MSPKKIIFPLFLGILIIIGLFSSLNNVQATNYEWLLNGNAESGLNYPWIPNTLMLVQSETKYSGTYAFSTTFTSQLMSQSLAYLDSDAVQSVSCWALAQSSSTYCAIQVQVLYSDGTFNQSTSVDISQAGAWTQLTFSNFINANKYIIGFSIGLQSGSTTYNTYLDDISLIANTNVQRFIWDITPTVIAKTNSSFTALQGIQYVFMGFLHNGTALNENGEFNVTSTKTTIYGNIVNGFFSFTIVRRDALVTIPYEFINIGIKITGGETVIFRITATWNYNGYTIGGTDETGNIPNTNLPITSFITFILLLCFIVLPAIGFGFYCGFHNVNPLFGFIGALTMLTAVGYLVTLVPLWFFATTIIVDVVLGLYIFNSSRSGGTG